MFVCVFCGSGWCKWEGREREMVVHACEGVKVGVRAWWGTRSHVRGSLYKRIATEEGRRKEKEKRREWWRRGRKGCGLSYFFSYCSVHTQTLCFRVVGEAYRHRTTTISFLFSFWKTKLLFICLPNKTNQIRDSEIHGGWEWNEAIQVQKNLCVLWE